MSNIITTSSEQIIEPLTDAEIAEIDHELHHVFAGNKRAVCIDALKIVQQHRGWISDDTIKSIAQHLELSPATVDGVATFFNLIYRQSVGKKVISLCDSVSCWIMGKDNIHQHICKKLNISDGETTEDGEYTLIPIACLGDCDHAPVMMINDDLHRNLDTDSIDKILEKS